MKYICPQDIIKFFDTEAMAAELGRQAVIDWMNTLPLEVGDRILIPVYEGGALHQIIKTEPGIQ